MKIKTNYILSTLSIVALLSVNYYVSSTTAKYDFPKNKPLSFGEDKKIDKTEVKVVEKQAKKKSYTLKKTNEEIAQVPSLFELSQTLGVPVIVSSLEEELTYPE